MEFSDCNTQFYRMIIAVCWSVLFQFVVMTLYITIMSTNIWDLSGLAFIPFQCLSIKSLYFIPLAGVVILLGIVWSADYNRPANTKIISRRFLLFVNLFSYDNLVTLAAHLLLGITIPSIYATLSNESISSISVKCKSEGSYVADKQLCLNEKKFFLILGGVWIAIYTFFKESAFNKKSIIFPIIQQLKFRRFKATIYPSFKRCSVSAVFPSLLFYICYYFKGNLPRFYFSLMSGLEMSDNTLDSFYELLDKELIIYLWLFSTIFLLTLDVMNMSYNFHLTERAYFPVSSYSLKALGGGNNFYLQDALLADGFPVIQHLGFLDLALLSQMDCERRGELFMLSQPGGHPLTWRAIVNACFKVIDTFMCDLNKCMEDLCPKPIENLTRTVENIAFSPSLSHQRSFNMRNLSLGPNVECIDQSPVLVLQKSCERLLNVYLAWIRGKLDAFCKKPVIAYAFGEMQEPKIKQLLLQSQRAIWAVESLSYLFCHSIKEDDYGIAQEDLSKVITVLLNLKNSVDKFNKQSVFITKVNKLDLVSIQMKNALKCTVKQSIYRIAIAFKDFIFHLNLSSDHVTQMHNFVELKEA